MSNKPIFSIIIPTFNSITFVDNAINTVLKQSFKDYELIIIDGLSNDGTLDLIKEYAVKSQERIKFISEKDKGIYDAMNKGIDLAKGEWLYFLGSDDRFANDDVLENIHKKIRNESNSLSLVYGDVIRSRTGDRYIGELTGLKIFTNNICHQAAF